MGLAIFLIHMVQLQASFQNFNIDLYLQSNISNQIFKWYKHCNSALSPSNDPENFPPMLHSFSNSQPMPSTDPYVNFVTTEVWDKNVTQGDNNSLSEELHKQRL